MLPLTRVPYPFQTNPYDLPIPQFRQYFEGLSIHLCWQPGHAPGRTWELSASLRVEAVPHWASSFATLPERFFTGY